MGGRNNKLKDQKGQDHLLEYVRLQKENDNSKQGLRVLK